MVREIYLLKDAKKDVGEMMLVRRKCGFNVFEMWLLGMWV